MARYNANRVPYPAQERLMDAFCEALCRLRTTSAVRNFLKDLLNRQERLMLVRRFQVAEMLQIGKTYREIQQRLRIGSSTTARVDRWLHFGRGGYRIAIVALKGKSRQS